MQKTRIALTFALFTLLGTITRAGVPLINAPSTPGVVTLIYAPDDGHFSVDTGGSQLTTIELKSVAGYLTGARPAEINGLFDVFTKNKLFKLVPGGMGNTDFGTPFAGGLSGSVLSLDLSLNGSMFGGGALGRYGLWIVPEPTGLTLLSLALPVLAPRRK